MMKLEIVVSVEKKWQTLASKAVDFDDLEADEIAEMADAAAEATRVNVLQLARRVAVMPVQPEENEDSD